MNEQAWNIYSSLILDFIAANFAEFESHCEEHQEDAEKIYIDLGGES